MQDFDVSQINISFLESNSTLYTLAGFAVQYIESDPGSSIIKQGMMLEYVVKTILQINGLYNRDSKLKDCIDDAEYYGLLPKDSNTKEEIWKLRIDRNSAVHDFKGNSFIAKHHLGFIIKFGDWFIQNFWQYKQLYAREDGIDNQDNTFNLPLGGYGIPKMTTREYTDKVLNSFTFS